MTDDPKYLDAKRHVEALKGLYIHTVVFVCVMAGLVGLNVLATGADWWVQWPFLGWGIGLFLHALAVYAPFRLFGRGWEERKIQRYMSRR